MHRRTFIGSITAAIAALIGYKPKPPLVPPEPIPLPRVGKAYYQAWRRELALVEGYIPHVQYMNQRTKELYDSCRHRIEQDMMFGGSGSELKNTVAVLAEMKSPKDVIGAIHSGVFDSTPPAPYDNWTQLWKAVKEFHLADPIQGRGHAVLSEI